MVSALSRWRRLDESRQKLAKVSKAGSSYIYVMPFLKVKCFIPLYLAMLKDPDAVVDIVLSYVCDQQYNLVVELQIDSCAMLGL